MSSLYIFEAPDLFHVIFSFGCLLSRARLRPSVGRGVEGVLGDGDQINSQMSLRLPTRPLFAFISWYAGLHFHMLARFCLLSSCVPYCLGRTTYLLDTFLLVSLPLPSLLPDADCFTFLIILTRFSPDCSNSSSFPPLASFACCATLYPDPLSGSPFACHGIACVYAFTSTCRCLLLLLDFASPQCPPHLFPLPVPTTQS